MSVADDVPLERQIACVKRELAMRGRAYPRWIAAGRMTQAKADQEVREMEAVLATVQAAAAAAKPDLFRA